MTRFLFSAVAAVALTVGVAGVAGVAAADQVYCHTTGCVTVRGGPDHAASGERTPVLPQGVATSLSESPPLLAQPGPLVIVFGNGGGVVIAPR